MCWCWWLQCLCRGVGFAYRFAGRWCPGVEACHLGRAAHDSRMPSLLFDRVRTMQLLKWFPVWFSWIDDG